MTLRKPVFLPREIWEAALLLATHEAFPEVIRVLQLFGMERSAALTSEEAASLLDFSRYLQHRARLHFPYSDDAEPSFLEAHGDGFHEINMGIHEKLSSYLYSVFPEVFE